MTKRALISVYNKDGIGSFSQKLQSMGWEIISSSGTAAALTEAGVSVKEISDLTGVPAMLGGRVKTLHPTVAGGILARRDRPEHMADLERHRIPTIDMVVCSLYPFEETLQSGADLDQLTEQIDIGGVTLLRAAAKNYIHVVVISDLSDCTSVLEELEHRGDVSLETRQNLALKAFASTSRYDTMITTGLRDCLGIQEERLPAHMPMCLDKVQPLRYGENPYQKAALYASVLAQQPWEQLSGTHLSYNNILDMDGALRAMAIMHNDVGVAILKHTTPCGMAVGESVLQAYHRARDCDPLSAYGGVVAVTRTVDLKAAQAMGEHFIEVLVVPDIASEALEYLSNRRPSLRIVRWRGGRPMKCQITGTWGGVLIQEDRLPTPPSPNSGRWVGSERPELWDEILLAWRVAAISKSNAVAIVKDGAAVGIGMGFCSRLFAVDFAVAQAGEKAKGAVMASDAFFPFTDGLERAAQAGITAIIQPGGSIRDDEVTEKAKELGISMFLSGHRTFRH
ncbi:MAG: bifunctional phosphoribosylaminoimidazolecarboxamide formyltransferase/IMP cyclohydrolase PurH [Dethiosulfovibrio peptidovorans]|nr:MAG: bifunctional phosphoribosylaminoimidazolecarboxamide formyltransferase/IMP cyclohydrolase PurH [Dethiosulfovibrio peptidovorans]